MRSAETKAKLDTMIGQGKIGVITRILTCDVGWPRGPEGEVLEPPFTSGGVEVPAVPALPPAYDPATFDAAVWTDVTHLVSEWKAAASLSTQMGEISLAVPAAWGSAALADVFREMRVIGVQERYRGVDAEGEEVLTGWEWSGWYLSDGFSEVWDETAHVYQVAGRDALKLASLEPLGSEAGTVVYQPDIIHEGTLADRVALTYLRDGGDAYEYGVLSRGGHPQPNWADRPPPLLWVTNAPESEGQPVPLAIAGDAVQAVFGEGVLRVGKEYAHADPGDPPDFGSGLGIPVGQVPAVAGVVSRFAHPVMEGYDAESDVADALVVVDSGAGMVRVDSDLTGLPDGLTLVLLDGTGARLRTTLMEVEGAQTIIWLADGTVVVPVGSRVQYGECNRARDVARRVLLGAGYQVSDAEGPLYLHAPEMPRILGAGRDILLPPLTWRGEEGVTALGALEELRRRGYVPPNWVALATNDGQVRVRSVEQLPAGDAGIIGASVLVPPATVERADQEIATRVVARGLVRQVTNHARPVYADPWAPVWVPTVAVVDEADGGVQVDPPALGWTLEHSKVPQAGDLHGLLAERPSPAALSGLRLWGWHYHAVPGSDVLGPVRRVSAYWQGKGLVTVTFPEAVEIHRLRLNVSDPWVLVFQRGQVISDWLAGGNRFNLPNRSGSVGAVHQMQALAVEYLDEATSDWLPLASYLHCPSEWPSRVEVRAEEFDTRAPVRTAALRIGCVDPGVTALGTYNNGWYHLIVGVYLWKVEAWGSDEVRGVATLGETAPFASAGWRDARARLRTRTHTLPEAVPWAQTEDDVAALAALWLQELARDYAPRRVNAVRPDVDVGDTVRLTLPNAAARNYLVSAVERQEGVVSAACVDYTAPY